MSSHKLDPSNQINFIVAGLALILVGASLIVGQAGLPSFDIPGIVVVLAGFGTIGASFVRYPHFDKSLNGGLIKPSLA